MTSPIETEDVVAELRRLVEQWDATSEFSAESLYLFTEALVGAARASATPIERLREENARRVDLPPEGCRVLEEMSDEIGFSAATISSRIGVSEGRVREWQRAFKVFGLAEFGVLHDLDGEGLRGRGYWLNGSGDKLRAALTPSADDDK